MIKRTHFYSDYGVMPNGSYTFDSGTGTLKSWFPQPAKLLDFARSQIPTIPKEKVVVLALNRL